MQKCTAERIAPCARKKFPRNQVMPAVYLVLGLPGSGRREVVLDLIENGMPEARNVTVYQSADDAPKAGDPAAAQLAGLTGVTRVNYVFSAGNFALGSEAETDGAPETIFFLADGWLSPIDQLEAFPALLQSRGWELARILLVADCTRAAGNPPVEQWHEACVHFADCVLMNRRDNPAANLWAQQFQRKIKAARFPCLFLLVKKGRVDNALLVLFPEARRFSLVFDQIDPLDDLDLDEEDLPDDLLTLENKPDPYFERMPNGQRRKPVPDAATFLPA
jgi:hypothetical protein